MSLYGFFQSTGPTGFGYNSTAEAVTEGLDLSGRAYLLTGCNSGLGLETARVLALRGASVFAAARTEDKAKSALAGLPGEHTPLPCELSEPASVHAAVEQVLDSGVELDGIIANAGIMALPERTVKHGLELQFLTNHIGHFILVTGLTERLKEGGRVVMLSSSAHGMSYGEGIRFDDLDAGKGYTAWGAYGQSKLANLLFARELARRLEGRTANAVHPGVISTNLGRHMKSNPLYPLFTALGPLLVLKSIPQGAATQTFVAVHPDAADVNGEYWADCNVKSSSSHGRDAELARKLWQVSEELVAGLPS